MKKFNIYNETKEQLKKEVKLINKIIKSAIKYKKLKNIYFNIIIVNNDYIKEINKTYRNIDNPTDVISFALEDEDKENFTKRRLLGDIYISIEKAREQSILYKHTVDRELSFLAVHGLLHLLGYDHQTPEDEELMFKEQEAILNERKFSKKEKES